MLKHKQEDMFPPAQPAEVHTLEAYQGVNMNTPV